VLSREKNQITNKKKQNTDNHNGSILFKTGKVNIAAPMKAKEPSNKRLRTINFLSIKVSNIYKINHSHTISQLGMCEISRFYLQDGSDALGNKDPIGTDILPNGPSFSGGIE
jgi:hypothetical protein